MTEFRAADERNDIDNILIDIDIIPCFNGHTFAVAAGPTGLGGDREKRGDSNAFPSAGTLPACPSDRI
jgi:hypothetical protein